MAKHLVLVGGGHAHVGVLKGIGEYVRSGHRVTLISPDRGHYYSGMGPGMLSRIYGPDQVRLPVADLAHHGGAQFRRGRVVSVNHAQRKLVLHSGEAVAYDVVSFNTGSKVPVGGLLEERHAGVFPVKPVANLLCARRFVREQVTARSRLHIVVVGGGPAGVEVAGNVWRLVADEGGEAAITLLAGGALLRDLPGRSRRWALESLGKRRIRVLEWTRARRVEADRVRLEDGACLRSDVTFIATGVQPSSLYEESGLPTGPGGGLLVNDALQSVARPDMFGGGDCIEIQGRRLARVGVHAVREGELLSRNLLAALEGRSLESFTPRPSYLLILNMGDGTGIARKGGFVYHGPFAFRLKDYIDRRFTRRARVMEHSGSLTLPIEGEQ